MPKKNKKLKKHKSKKKFKVISLKQEKINYDKVRHETSLTSQIDKFLTI